MQYIRYYRLGTDLWLADGGRQRRQKRALHVGAAARAKVVGAAWMSAGGCCWDLAAQRRTLDLAVVALQDWEELGAADGSCFKNISARADGERREPEGA